ncbi:transcriptional regulator LysR family [Photobacterium aphoticum]|uniref:Transcriptional regulator LysR family n=1 Tax=Photobacterium aphoticum TaxID=754436 RepID=A0A090QME3_9GAMM|nr:transcriptional regulator LysR family [Photobacterium aphoticum]
MRKRVPLKSIYAFVAVAELGSMSEAAQHLSVSHSAVSQAIKSLETQLGVVLFRRVGRRVELNAQGRKYYRKVAPALTQIVEASESIARQTHSHRLTVNMVHSLALHWWIPNVAEFQAYAPHIDVRISNILGVFDLDHEGVDVALLHGLPDEWQGDYCEKLGDDALIMVCSPHLLEGLKNTNVDDSQSLIQDGTQQDKAYLPTALLAQYPAIFATHPRRQKDWEVWCQAHGVAVPQQQKNLSFHAPFMPYRRQFGG